MGLSIYYRLKAKADAAGARELVKRLHSLVVKLPFDEVSSVHEYDPPDGQYIFERGADDSGHLKPGWLYVDRKRADGLKEIVQIPPLHVVCFDANLRGSETASFGLASHPRFVIHREDIVTHPPDCQEQRQISAGEAIEFNTRLSGWYSWSNSCKTQYAANPKFGGVDNFLRAHRAVYSAIDECKKLGLTTYIRDDAKYWRHRDDAKLVAELERWNELIASFVGRVGDKIGDARGGLIAPIKDRPDFEHLEARGNTRMREGRSGKKRAKHRRKDS